jgi:type VI secretion system protein ImpH
VTGRPSGRSTARTIPPRQTVPVPESDWPPDAQRFAADVTSREFFQAVRLLERLFPNRAAVGEFADPADEVVRFAVTPGTAFPASEIQALEPPPAPGEPPRMTVNFMGTHGPQGVMPLVYNAFVAERTRARDHALREFLDIFNHRIISLFYRAWAKYRVDALSERPAADGVRDPFAQHLLDLVGLGTPGLQRRLPMSDQALLQYAGLLGPQPRSAVALEQLLADYFDVRAEVQQFVGAWFSIDASSQTSLDDHGPETQLGLGAVVGDELWDCQSRVRVRLGPLARRDYDRFLPGGEAHEQLRALVRFYAGDEIEFELQLVLARDEVPACVLGGDDASGASTLGWSTWLRSAPLSRDPDDTVLTL